MKIPEASLESDEEFNQYYQLNILPLKQELEQLRSKKLSSFKNRVVVLVAMLIMAALYIYDKDFQEERNIIIAAGFFLVMQFFLTILPIIQYKNLVKDQVYPIVLKYFGNFNLESGGVKESHITDSRLFDYYDIYKFDDYIVGSYKDVDIEICELSLLEWKRLNKRRYLHTVFKGVFIRLDVYKEFSGETVIMPDAFLAPSSVSGLERIKLEDPVFEKKFDVYGDDQIEARYLVTPTFMERIIKLADLYKDIGLGMMEKYVNSDFKCSFVGSNLYIAIPCSTDLFETNSIFKEALRDKDIYRLVYELKLILQVIDQLKMDKKLRI